MPDPGEYHWCHYQMNGLGKIFNLCTPQKEYLRLGKNESERQCQYRMFLSHHIDGELLNEIRNNIYKGMAVGNDRFKEEIEAMT